MRQAFLLGYTVLVIIAALTLGAVPVSAGNTMEGTVISTNGGTLVVRMASGEESSFMPDGVSVPLALLSAGDPVVIQLHPTDNGPRPRVTVTRGSSGQQSDNTDERMQTELVGTGMIPISISAAAGRSRSVPTS